MKPAISVRNLGKHYKLGLVHTDLLSERLGNGLRAIGSRFRSGKGYSRTRAQQQEFFWALKDISFEVQPGEVMGIIGRNGAGKSTLLKILSRITSPTTGEIRLQGRVASLLEVGTGFHPELTGRENIFLNGAILGMTRQEIKGKYDAIVDFAEIERFIDTPVKRYSSGMYVRLAFAVAAHLEPEILVVDEVLAVGDSAFQKKCLNKLSNVAGEGRTILFVSHNIDAVRRLCTRVLWLNQGEILEDGTTDQCVTSYQMRNANPKETEFGFFPYVFSKHFPLVVHSLSLSRTGDSAATEFLSTEDIYVEIAWENTKRIFSPRVGLVVQSSDGHEVVTILDGTSERPGWVEAGRKLSSCILPKNVLNEGEYIVELCADAIRYGDDHEVFDLGSSRHGPIMRFNVVDPGVIPGKYYGEEGIKDRSWPGPIMLPIHWARKRI